MRQFLVKARLLLAVAMFSALFALASFGGEALAQVPNPTAGPAPTPAPSGSNPTVLAPTDVSPDFALLCVLGFFAVLLIWLVAATFYTRAGVFEDPNSDPGY